MSMPTPMPTRNRAMNNCVASVMKAETIENKTKKTRLATKMARRPSRSDKSPKISRPTIAPRKVEAPNRPVA
jgi:hypothetical protein